MWRSRTRLLMADRLARRRVALVFVGPVDAELATSSSATLVDAGAGTTLRMRALRVPVDTDVLGGLLEGRPAARAARPAGGCARPRPAACARARPWREGPVWRLLSPQLVAERSGNEGLAADAVVVARSVAPQQGPTSRLLRGFYEGLAASGVPAVGVETSKAAHDGGRCVRQGEPLERRFRGHGGGTVRPRPAARGRPARELRPQTDGDGRHPAADRGGRRAGHSRASSDSTDNPHRGARRGGADRSDDRRAPSRRCPTRR